MNPFEFVIAIIAIVIGAQTIQKLAKIRSEKSASSNEDVDDAHAKLDALEERIRVLERIITENKYDLKREIDKL